MVFGGSPRLDITKGANMDGLITHVASDIETGANVAVKLEEEHGQFHETEVEFYKRLKNSQGIPKMHWSGKEGEFKAIVLEFLGPSLQDLHYYCGQQFSRKTVLMLADQLICRLRHIHSKNIIHCDIKPSNCLMGVGREGNTVYLTDFGISRQYEPDHDPATGNGGLIGTIVFASRNAQSGESSCSGHQKCHGANDWQNNPDETTWRALGTCSFICCEATCLGNPYPLQLLRQGPI
jgi:serine/threonine protein kinase